jgi:hypothetical protein
MDYRNYYELQWMRFFAFTVIVEALVAFPMLGATDKSSARRIGAILVANLTTHPLVFFFFARVMHDRTAMTIVAESWALLAETGVYALIFSSMKGSRALTVSALANAASFIVGSVATRLHWLA